MDAEVSKRQSMRVRIAIIGSAVVLVAGVGIAVALGGGGKHHTTPSALTAVTTTPATTSPAASASASASSRPTTSHPSVSASGSAGSAGNGSPGSVPSYGNPVALSPLSWRTLGTGSQIAYSSSTAFAVRFDQSQVRFVLHPGSQVPGWPGNSASTTGLVAGWNGGFLFTRNASWGGFYLNGKTAYGPLRAGIASEVFYADGSMDVQAWGGGAPGANVVGVRQNLVLMVNGGALASNLSQGTLHDEENWGWTNNSSDEYANRSGVGVTGDGQMIYAAAENVSPLQLAQLMVRAGAVRAMELDINMTRPIFGTYSGGWSSPAGFLGGPYVFTSGDDRDFVAVYHR